MTTAPVSAPADTATPQPRHLDVAIIGAGLSGLAAGIRCAYFEKNVAIFERHTTIGGLNSFYRLRRRDHDVGLHAVTNYAAPGTRRGPMAKLLKALRLRWDDFDLRPQLGSKIAFPDATLAMTNDADVLRAAIADRFGDQIDGFDRLREHVNTFDAVALDQKPLSARAVVGQFVTDPLLTDMLFCPLCYYGSAVPGDMDFSQFCIMWQAVFEEGFGRPYGGVRPLMKTIVQQYREFGGQLHLRTGIRRIQVEDGRAVGLVLDDGSEVTADVVLSSAGALETRRLCEANQAPAPPRAAPTATTSTSAAFDVAAVDPPPDRRLGFCEAIYVLDQSVRMLGHEDTIVFFGGYASADREADGRFRYDVPATPVDTGSGVICSPNNFAYSEADGDPAADLPEGILRVTCLADPTFWTTANDAAYDAAKADALQSLAATAAPLSLDPYNGRADLLDTDLFTPRTITKYTGHPHGAIYGSPQKHLDGSIGIENLSIIGTDQGFLGIVGAMLSGISIANTTL